MDSAAAARDFSHTIGELLLEQGIEQGIILPTNSHPGSHRPHQPCPIDTTLKNLTQMKNAVHKSIHAHCDKFLNLVKAHHVAKE